MASGDAFVEIDGSMLEGGGQILRMSSALSVILKKPIHVTKIRAGRDKPGLRPQHLSGLELLRDLSHGELRNAAVGSTEIWFKPDKISAGSYVADTGTAGSITLLLQSALPCLSVTRQPVNLSLRGGTNVDFAPQFEYFRDVLLPHLRSHLGLSFDVRLVRKGFFPKGNGEVTLTSNGHAQTHLPAFTILERGEISEISGDIFGAGNATLKNCAQAHRAATDVLQRSPYTSVPFNVSQTYEPANRAFGTGEGVNLVAKTSSGCLIGADSLGGKRKQPQQLGTEAATRLVTNLNANGCVDEHLQDQLLIFACLAEGTTKYRTGELTLHTKTAIHIAQLMTSVKITTAEQPDGTNIIEVQGIGFEI